MIIQFILVLGLLLTLLYAFVQRRKSRMVSLAISVTSVVRSSRPQGESSALTRVQSWVGPCPPPRLGVARAIRDGGRRHAGRGGAENEWNRLRGKMNLTILV